MFGAGFTGLSERTGRLAFESIGAVSAHIPVEVRRAVQYWISCLHDAHATITWLAIVSATRLVLDISSTRLDDTLLRTVSTNLDNLKAHPVHVLITSACFIQQPSTYWWFVLICVIVLAPLEKWIGTGRWLLGLVIGHVGSTIIIAIGLEVSSNFGHTSEDRAIDVGVSYGVRMLAALFVYRWSGWPRYVLGAGVVTFAISQVAISHTFADWGHFMSVMLGLILGPLLVRGKEPARLPALAALLGTM